jgi:hypothetical protein
MVSSRSILATMSIRERTRRGPLWAVLALLLLAGVLAMHALAPHDGSMRWMGSNTRTAMASAADPEVSRAMSPAPMLLDSAPRQVITAGSARTGDRVSMWPAPEDHDAMDLCVAILMTLLLVLARAAHYVRTGAAGELSVSRHPATGRPPPVHLRPSLNGLCIARV